ncbi:MAG: xylulokinase [Candidatus Helarchaeota archaeon]
MGYILAHDMGTSGTASSLINLEGQGGNVEIVNSVIREYDVIYPQLNWAEQDPVVWWKTIVNNTSDLVAKTNIDPDDIDAIIHATQMAGTLPVDKTGKPLMNCMIWMDARATNQAKKLMDLTTTGAMLKNIFKIYKFLKITGAGPGPKDILPKIIWVKEERPKMYADTYKFLDCKDWLLYKSTGKFITSRDCASVSWILDINEGAMNWSEKICEIAKIDINKLPEVGDSTDIIGELSAEAANAMDLKPGIPVINGCGDMSAALVGSGAVRENEVHLYVGSSAWLISPVSRRLRKISVMTGTVLGPDPEKKYMLVAHQESAGACLKWIRDQVGKNETYQDLDRFADSSSPGSHNLIFTPWMFGERTPIQDPTLRGGFFNLSLDHTRSDLIRSVLEGVAFHVKWMLIGVEELLARNKGKVKEINIIGGGASSNIWCQIFADIMEKTINSIANPFEAGSIGTALIAGVGLGQYKNFDAVKEKVKIKTSYKPQTQNKKTYDKLFKIYLKIYEKTKDICRELNKKP